MLLLAKYLRIFIYTKTLKIKMYLKTHEISTHPQWNFQYFNYIPILISVEIRYLIVIDPIDVMLSFLLLCP